MTWNITISAVSQPATKLQNIGSMGVGHVHNVVHRDECINAKTKKMIYRFHRFNHTAI